MPTSQRCLRAWRRPWRFVVLTTLGGVCLLGAGCRRPEPARDKTCAAKAQKVAADFAPLCQAWESALHEGPPGLAGIALAPLDRPPVPTLPPGASAVLGPRFLVLGDHEIAAWRRELPPAFGQKGPTGRESEWPGSRLVSGGAGHHPRGTESTRRLPQIDDSGGGGFARSQTLDERVVAQLRALRARQHQNNGLLLVAISKDTPAGQVTAFLELVRQAEFQRVSFLFATASPPSRPAASSVGSSGRGAHWEADLEAALRPWRQAPCDPVKSLREGLRGVSPRLRCAAIARAVREALTVCRCPVSEAPLMTALRQLLTPPRFVSVHEVTLRPGSAGPKVESMGEPWSSLAPRVVALPPRAFWMTGPTLESVRRSQNDGWVGFPVPRRPVFAHLVEVARTAGDGLEVAEVQRVVKRRRGEIQSCYVSVGLPRNPRLAGEAALSFLVAPSGQTRGVRLVHTTLKDPRTETCIREMVGRWRFPVPEGSPPRFTVRLRFIPPSSTP